MLYRARKYKCIHQEPIELSNTAKTNIPEGLGGSKAWLIWSLAALAFGYAFFHRVAPSVMVSELMGEFAIGGAMLGTLSALYFYPYVLLQLPLGGLLDLTGTRILLSSAIALASLGSILFGMATTIEIAYLGRVLIGIGSSVGFLGSLALASRWFPLHRYSFLAGLTMFFGMMSGMLAQAPLALFVERFGWRANMWGLGVVGLLLALMILVFVRNAPPNTSLEKKGAPKKPGETWKTMRKGLARAASSLEVWKIALIAATMSGPMLTLGGLWGTPYLMSAYSIPRPEAALLTSLMLIGWAIGAPFNGWLSERIRRRKHLLIGGMVMLNIALALIVFLPQPPLWLIVSLMILAGFSGSAMTSCFALVREVAPAEIAGSVTGIVNSMTVASGALLQPLVGLLLDYWWNGALTDGARTYTGATYQLSFSIILLSAFIGLLATLRLKEVRA
jgi:MFS family permease